MNNNFFIKILGIILMTLGTQALAGTFTLKPSSIVNAANCTSGTNTNAAVISTVESCSGQTGLSLLYKSEVGNAVDSGTYKDSYTTTYFNTSTDPEDALITFDKGPLGAMDCMKTYSCWLSVKDGKSSIALYVFSLAGWDGVMDLSLMDFWPKQGAISNIQIWGGAAIAQTPIPAAVWLFGSGFIGLMSLSRKIRVNA